MSLNLFGRLLFLEPYLFRALLPFPFLSSFLFSALFSYPIHSVCISARVPGTETPEDRPCEPAHSGEDRGSAPDKRSKRARSGTHSRCAR